MYIICLVRAWNLMSIFSSKYKGKPHGRTQKKALDVEGQTPDRFLMNIVYGFAGSNASWNENFLTKMSEENTFKGSCLAVPSDSTGVILKIPNETSTRVKTTREETPAWSSANNNSLGVENKGLDVSESDLSLYHPDEFKGTNVYKLPSSTATQDPLETTCGPSSLYRMNSKLSSVSSDIASALPVTPGPKTVRAWLTDPQLYKVRWHMPCGARR